MTTFADKIAEKAFRSKKIQQSWEVHVRAFGPILTEAFCENEQARIHLTNALNHISRRDPVKGLERLGLCGKMIETDQDVAAYAFATALGLELVGERRRAFDFYCVTAKTHA